MFLDIRISTHFHCTVAIPVLSTIIWHKIQLQEMEKRIRVLQEKSHLRVPTDHYASSDTSSVSSRSSGWSSTSSALSSGYGSSRSSDWSAASGGLSSGYDRIMPLLRESHSPTTPEKSSTTNHHSSANSENTAATQK